MCFFAAEGLGTSKFILGLHNSFLIYHDSTVLVGTLVGRIYKLKVVIIAILVACCGIGNMVFAGWIGGNRLAPHVVITVLDGFADAFLVAGLIDLAIDVWTEGDR